MFPPSPIKRIVNAFTGGMTWEESQGQDRYRRAIYTFLKRSQPHPLFATFDMAERDVCSLRRFRTNTPLQAFLTLNDPSLIEAAQVLAARMLEISDGLDDDQMTNGISAGLAAALSRPVRELEVDRFTQLYEQTLLALISNRRQPPSWPASCQRTKRQRIRGPRNERP